MTSIRGLGVDVVEISRIDEILARHPARFVDRLCRRGETRRRGSRAAWAQHVGGLFAAKEAVLKALGTGWAHGLSFRQVEIRRTDDGQPKVRLHGKAAERADDMGVAEIHLTISHERTVAVAVAVLEGRALIGSETGETV